MCSSILCHHDNSRVLSEGSIVGQRSSTLWEAFTLGQHLRRHGHSMEGFRKSRGSSYVNARGVRF